MATLAAERFDFSFYSISVADIRNKWHGVSEKRIKVMFDEVRRSQAGGIIFIDEVESLCKDRTNPDVDTLSNDILSQLLTEMDGVGKDNKNVILLGATNCPQKLDAAMLRRFEYRVHISLPDLKERESMIKIHTRQSKIIKMKSSDYKELAQLTDGASGSDIKFLVQKTLLQPFKQSKGLSKYKKIGKSWLLQTTQDKACPVCPRKNSGDLCATCNSKWMLAGDVPRGTMKLPDRCIDDFKQVKWHKTASKEQIKECDEFAARLRELGD